MYCVDQNDDYLYYARYNLLRHQVERKHFQQSKPIKKVSKLLDCHLRVILIDFRFSDLPTILSKLL